MNTNTKTGYVEFTAKVRDIETDIRILETITHVFIYVNQDDEKINLYDEDLRRFLISRKLRNNKKMVVFCNLKSRDNLKAVGEFVYDVFTK
ncbi:hypothetical protein NBO_33g0009 [Nosema bombycis CQ1]|jgi:hypothetical protein|uniref:Uncharacterized protein n=1 Tax=Nosema bombycis (strain CQ1 / CVCC 102059) TaxID=578461 RepID=R0MMU9_NOSB1|nr:hypothetical protein NBO_33g0009 [Nosema bombycis CQ1]|eukprot:EOB14203.1 hypothetical protein NBO_33g0009 [Nosema bombycis CQ1]